MKTCPWLAVLLVLCSSPPSRAETIHWINGRWYDGRGFSERSFYSVDGRLTDGAPPKIDRTVDLAGRHVLPPFGDAHHHGIDSAPGLDGKINHLPTPRADFSADLSAYLIDEESARTAARKGITVVTTVSTLARMGGSRMTPEQLAAARANQKTNLDRIASAGVRIAIGSDGMSGEQPLATALSEALYLHEHGFFDAATLLRLWTEDTPAAIFPDRRIGRLEPGYEASFLVLDADPLADFGNVRKIGMRVKQGRIVDLAPAGTH